MKKIIIFLLSLIMIACKSTKVTQSSTSVDSAYIYKDSSKIEYKYVEVPVEVPKVTTEYITKEIHDSIYTHDSIFIKDKGDTIFVYKETNKYKQFTVIDTLLLKDTVPVVITLHDTLYREVHTNNDSIKTSATNNLKVETVEINKLHWWQKVLIWIGGIALICGLGYGCYKIYPLIHT